MIEEYEINKFEIFNILQFVIQDFEEKHDRKPELLTISAEYGEAVARAISAGLFIVVALDNDLLPETVKLGMLPEDNHE